MPKLPLIFTLLMLLAAPAAAAPPRPGFVAGPVFSDFGHIAPVASDLAIPADAAFKVAFDLSAKATPGEISKTIDSAARFINMHVAAGVPVANVKVAIVVHGAASGDLLKPEAYAARNNGAVNGSVAAIAALTSHGVDIWLCGQSAVASSIDKADLIPGVKMALSAMTAFALLQRQGYTVNPF
ncbi:MAG: DsrE family protein [Sphingomonadaceae bacterium]|nr:DsrE family protein [Sphingomonadaceae bacterium]